VQQRSPPDGELRLAVLDQRLKGPVIGQTLQTNSSSGAEPTQLIPDSQVIGAKFPETPRFPGF
jgi:hypothetical protein